MVVKRFIIQDLVLYIYYTLQPITNMVNYSCKQIYNPFFSSIDFLNTPAYYEHGKLRL